MRIASDHCQKDMTSTAASEKRPRKKWVRKAPLISCVNGSNDASVDPHSMKTKYMMMASDNKKQSGTMDDLRKRLLNFLKNVHLEEWYV